MGEPIMSPDAQVELAETKAALARAITSLPEQRRAALLLRWQHEMPYDQIAQALGVTSAAARQLVTRARETVRTALALTE
jgi:RNA polymerase sigma-70 factor (ECF subfamily)